MSFPRLFIVIHRFSSSFHRFSSSFRRFSSFFIAFHRFSSFFIVFHRHSSPIHRLRNSLRRMSIAIKLEREYRCHIQQILYGLHDIHGFCADDVVVAAACKLSPFGLVAECHAVFFHVVGLFLQSAAVSHHQRAVTQQVEHLQIADGFNKLYG